MAHLFFETMDDSSPGTRFSQTLIAAGQGDSQARAHLLPLVYDELRRLARARLAAVPSGNTLTPTELVHEAYLCLVGHDHVTWRDQREFFAAAAMVMRDILVEHARRRSRQKRGGDRRRVALGDADELAAASDVDYVALDMALTQLGTEEPEKAEVVMLRFFAGLTIEETAAAVGSSPATVKRHWNYARAWLYDAMSGAECSL